MHYSIGNNIPAVYRYSHLKVKLTSIWVRSCPVSRMCLSISDGRLKSRGRAATAAVTLCVGPSIAPADGVRMNAAGSSTSGSG